MDTRMTETWTANERSSGRPMWKTLLGVGLLCFLPVVGVSMATMYWLTRKEPDRYDGGAAAGAGVAVLVIGLVMIGLFFFGLSVLANIIVAIDQSMY